MKRGNWVSKNFSANSDSFFTVVSMPISANVDRIVLAVYNTDQSASTETITFRVFVQLVENGGFVEVAYFGSNPGFSSHRAPLKKGEAFWGFIDDLGIEAIQVEVMRSGSAAIPGLVEIKCLSEGQD